MTEPGIPSSGFTSALIAELAKKTGVSWLRYDGQTHAAWHLWFEDSLCLVSGGNEQYLPGIEHADRVEVMMRSKENGGRLITWIGSASVVPPSAATWPAVTAALVSDRLNLDDPNAAAAEWARLSVVSRIVPTGEVVEAPGALSADAHLATPAATKATTRGGLPRVLHRRVKRRPKLS